MAQLPLNKVYLCDCVKGLAQLPPHSAQLIIADPPYYRVKGEFDKAWPDWAAYMADARKWAEAMARALAPNGTLLWYGFHKTIARMQVMLEERFNMLSNCVIVKRNSIQNKFSSPEAARTFMPNEERLLAMSSKCDDLDETAPQLLARNKFRYAEGMCFSKCMRPLIDYLHSETKRAGFTPSRVRKELGVSVALHWYTYKSQWELPTAEWYARLRGLLNGNTEGREYLRKEYEELRKEYEELRRPFNTHHRRLTDVLEVSCDSSISARLGHPTVKDWGLTRLLVETCSRQGGLVVAPFAGSGTECAVARALGRQYVGFDTEPRYVELANRRAEGVQTIIDF